MSTVFSKNRNKRPHTSSNETNTSFVKNVTSRVSGLLPSTITKWFSSPSSSNANGSAPTADATDSSTEDEAPESPIVTQPPPKRMRFNSSNKFNHFGPTDANCSTSKFEITELPVTPFSDARFPSRNNWTLPPIRTANEKITAETNKDKNERDTSRFKSTQHTIATIGQSVATKRKSIFDKSSEGSANTSSKQSPNAEKKPSFKPSLLGSPFYPGRTMYGGAASSYINQPNIQQHTVAFVNEPKSSEDSTMSSSARRIMDLLESYSSPLMEARRIPQYTIPKNDTINTSTERFAPYANRSLSYKTQELHVPSIASILRLKQRSRLMDTTKTARQIIASHSSATNYPLIYPTPITNTSQPTETIQPDPPRQEIDKEQNNKMTTKVKARVTRSNRGQQDQHEMATPVKLPSATLQIDQNKTLKFSFDTPVSKLPATSTPKIVFPAPKPAETKKNTEVSTSKPETVTNSRVYTFSNPVKICYDILDNTATPPKFTFESPERRIEQNCGSKSDVSSVVGDIDVPDKSTAKLKDWSCPDCWVSNKASATKCVCCGYKQAKVSKCAVCKLADSQAQKDKCVNCEKMASPPSAKTAQSSKWKCDACWVMNEDSAEKCVCCGGNKPNAANKAAAAAKTAEFGALPKIKTPPCGGCFTVGGFGIDPKKDKPAPVAPATNNTFFGSSDKNDNTFIAIVKSQRSDKWECGSCLVQNESEKTVCVCCGAEKEPKNKLPDTKFNFGTPNSLFKFGIDPKVQEAKISKKSDEKSTPEPKLKEQSETNNNVLAETPTFTFTLPTKKAEVKPDVLKTDAKVPVKFSFGIPKDPSVPSNKVEPPKVIIEDKEKPQEVPQVNFASPAQETVKPVGLFGSPLTAEDKDEPAIPTSKLFSLPTTEAKKDIQSIPITIQPIVTSVETSQTQNTFSLGVSTLKPPTTNLFGTPATVASTLNPFTAQAQTTSVAVSASSMSIVIPSATTSQKSEATGNTKLTSAAPMFSFGTNNASSLATTSSPAVAPLGAPADKPKFQFTFGSNSSPKTEAAPPPLLAGQNPQPVFKSPFGATSDSIVKNTNTFSLNSGNGLGTHNPLSTTSTNGLSAPNGLSGNNLSANTIGGNTMGNNNLSSNPLASSTLTGNGLSGNLLGGNALAGNTFGANSLTGGNGVTSTSTLGGTNGLPGNTHTGGNALQTNNTLTSNALSSGTPNIFGNAVPKENMWNANNNAPSTNLFVSNTATNSLQKPPTFTFGASTPFNASSPPPFSNNAQPSQNIFGMGNQNNNAQPSMFSSPVQNQNPPPLFGATQPASNPPPQMGMFGTPNIGATPTFGSPNSTIPTFEAASMAPGPAPAFNFGAPAQSSGIFGFGQQQQQPQPQQAGVYSFGGPPPGTPQVQFAMGTAPNPAAGRRMRKAVRRTTPR